MRKFIVLACLMALVAMAAEPTKSHVFEMRPVMDTASAETEPMTVGPQHLKVNVGKGVLLDESALKSVKASTDKQGFTRMDLTFTSDGAKKFATVTEQNIGKRIAMVIDGKAYSAPVIASVIKGGKAQIAGLPGLDEAKELAGKINEAIKTQKSKGEVKN